MLFWAFAALVTVGALLLMFWPILARNASEPGESAGGRHARRLLLGLSFAVPVIAVAAYLADGRPGLPDRPYAKREAERVAAGLPGDRERALVRELALQMERHPENSQGWTMLADAYMREARFEEAAASYRNALSAKPGDASLLSGLGEALTLQAQGEITPDAEDAFGAALETNPADEKARFFMALAKAQRGEAEKAKADLSRLLQEAAPDAPWRGAIEAALARIEQDLRSKDAPAN